MVQWLKKNRPTTPILWVNRTVAALADLEGARGVETMALADFLASPAEFTHLFTATSSREPVFTAPFFEKLAGPRRLVFDFAEPVDVEISAASQTKALVLSIRDFEAEAKKNAASRSTAIEDAEKIIDAAMRDYLRVLKETPLLKEFSTAVVALEENLICMLAEISVEVPEPLHGKIKQWSQKLVRKNLHLSREHLKEVIHKQTDPSSRPAKG